MRNMGHKREIYVRGSPSNLAQNVYMDDIALLQYFDTPDGCDELIREVDQGLVKGSLHVK